VEDEYAPFGSETSTQIAADRLNTGLPRDHFGWDKEPQTTPSDEATTQAEEVETGEDETTEARFTTNGEYIYDTKVGDFAFFGDEGAAKEYAKRLNDGKSNRDIFTWQNAMTRYELTTSGLNVYDRDTGDIADFGERVPAETWVTRLNAGWNKSSLSWRSTR
jgi:hypothetical protein